MTISVGCPDCGKNFKVPDSLAGKKGRCKACGGTFQVPVTMESVPEVDPFYDLEAPLPPRKTSPTPVEDTEVNPARVTRSVKTRTRRPQSSGDGETDPVYKWGFGTIIFAMLGLFLPLAGIQFTILNLLPPEAQAGILFLALLIGTGLLAGGKPANTFQRVAKYLWLTFTAFVILVVALGILGVISGQNGAAPQPPTAVPDPPTAVPNPRVQFQPPPNNVVMPPVQPPPNFLKGRPNRPGPNIPRPFAPRPGNPGGVNAAAGQILFSLSNCQASRKSDEGKNQAEFRIEYQATGTLPAGTMFFAVAESGVSKANIPIHRIAVQNGQVSWSTLIKDGDNGPFRFFIATVSYGPGGKAWVKASNVVEGIPLSGN